MDEQGPDSGTGPQPGRTEGELQFLSRAELEERMRQQRSELANVMAAMVDILIKLDDQGNIAMINEAVSDVLGYDPDDLEGKPADVLLAEPPSDSQSPVTSSGQLLERLLREGRVTDVEIYCSTAEGKTVPMSLSASTLSDEDGIPTGVVCVAKDISERKEAEEQAAFLHSLLRHDLGNSLQASLGYLEILTETEIDGVQREYVEHSLAAVEDAVELIEKVRTLSTIEGAESVTPTSLGTAVDGAIDRHEQLMADRGIQLRRSVDAATVLAGSLLTEVFANLVENAIVHADADTIGISTELDEGQVTVSVEDDGDGIPEERRDEIFERGFSTGDTSGSGLGMYIVNELVESYGGAVSIGDSTLGGARIDVELQLAED